MLNEKLEIVNTNSTTHTYSMISDAGVYKEDFFQQILLLLILLLLYSNFLSTFGTAIIRLSLDKHELPTLFHCNFIYAERMYK